MGFHRWAYLTNWFHVGPQRRVVILVGGLQRGQTRRNQVEVVSGLNAARERTERHVEPVYHLFRFLALSVPQTVPFLYSQHRFVPATRHTHNGERVNSIILVKYKSRVVVVIKDHRFTRSTSRVTPRDLCFRVTV